MRNAKGRRKDFVRKAGNLEAFPLVVARSRRRSFRVLAFLTALRTVAQRGKCYRFQETADREIA